MIASSSIDPQWIARMCAEKVSHDPLDLVGIVDDRSQSRDALED